MKNIIFLPFVLALTSFLHAQDYYRVEVNYATNDERVLSLYIPKNVTEIKGLIVHFHGSYRDDTAMARSNSDLISFASTFDFAVVSTGFWRISPLGNNSPFSDPAYTPEESIEAFEYGLSLLAAESEHPEIINAPWVLKGNSNGGRSTYYINSMRPEKVIAFVQSKMGFYYYDVEWNSVLLDPLSETARKNPGMIITGELDEVVDNAAIIEGYKLNQALGTNWAWIEIKNEGHNEADGPAAYFPFLAECVKLRYPENQSPINGPIDLIDLSHDEGWYISESIGSNGLHEIAPVSSKETIDLLDYGWAPNESVSKIFQCLGAQYRTERELNIDWSTKSCGTLGSNCPTKGDIITYEIDLTDINWTQIEFYERDNLLYAETNSQDNTIISQTTDLLSYEDRALMGYYAIITLENGTKEVTSIVNGNLFPKPLWTCFTESSRGLFSSWFGIIETEDRKLDDGWLKHYNHGRMYALAENTNSIWFWDMELKWWWTSEDYYPYVWSNQNKTWMCFYNDSNSISYMLQKNPIRYFWNYKLSQWESYGRH